MCVLAAMVPRLGRFTIGHIGDIIGGGAAATKTAPVGENQSLRQQHCIFRLGRKLSHFKGLMSDAPCSSAASPVLRIWQYGAQAAAASRS
jgi:hypothetical protein